MDQPAEPLRALVVTNMYPSAARPALGSFVRDQVESLRRIDGLDVQLEAFDGGPAQAYGRAGRALRRRYRGKRFDVVHAHFGLTAWPALAIRARVHAVTLHGTDLVHRRSRAITLAALPLQQIVSVVSEELSGLVPRWAQARSPVQVLPCGVALDRFRPIPRSEARAELGLDVDRPYLLFPSDPARPEKRFDLARELAHGAGGVELLTLGAVAPERVPLYVNAANAVIVPSDREGFGLAVLEALACDVPVLSTPHGIAVEALPGIAGTHCGEFALAQWGAALAPHLSAADPRVPGRHVAERYSADAMAHRVASAWRLQLSSATRG